MQSFRRGSVVLALLAAGAAGMAGSWLLFSAQQPGQSRPQGRVQGYVQNGRLIQDGAPPLPDPAAQREAMIASLLRIEKQLEAIERHTRMSYMALGSQSDASPNEKNR
jgi:hypothetical protein